MITRWYPNCARLWSLRKRVKGPLQRYSWSIKGSRTEKLVYPSVEHVIKKFRNSEGKVMNIYDTDGSRELEKVNFDYYTINDIRDMTGIIILGGNVPEEERANKLFRRIYGDTSYYRVYCRRADPIYD